MKRQTLSAIATLGIAALSILTSCQDEDFGYSSEDVRAGVYDRNFIKYYGEIPENQSWDMSSYGLMARIKAARENALTRGTGNFNSGDWCTDSGDAQGVTISYSSADAFTESHDLVQWVKKRLQEGDRLQKYGVTRTNKEEFNQRFSMIATEKSFQLMPVFQGIDNTIWDFHVVIEWLDENDELQTVDRVLWKKSQGMTMKGERPNLLGESIQDYVPDFHSLADLSSKSSSELSSDKGISPNNDVRYETTRLAADIKSQWVTVSGYPEGKAEINFYLHVLQDNDNVNSSMTNGKKFYSDCREYPTETAGNLVVLPVQVDIVQYQNREIVLMGCETALSSKNGGKSYNESEVHSGNTKHDYGDDDMNDIVFLLIGDETTGRLPKLVSENEVAKRYFFEDLGSVVDWDFNDVVLDMKQIISIESGKKMITQTATLKHRCGTTPFNLFLRKTDGTYTQLNFSNLSSNGQIPGVNEGSGMDQTQTITVQSRVEYSETAEYPWRPDDNNVAINVYTSGTPYKDKTPEGATNDSGDQGVWSAYQDRYHEADGKRNIPRVFVADQSVWWTAEGQNFPNMWTYPSTAITTRPAGAEPNDYSSGSLYGIGSDRSFRYPFIEGDKLMLWNTPTFFDDWEPLWLSEGFMEGVSQGYNTINIEFGSNNNTQFALLYRKDYVEVDAKFGGDNNWRDIPSNNLYTFTLPASGDGSVTWYLAQKNDGYSPSFGIQDLDDYDGHNAGNYHIQINKVWMTKGSTPSAPTPDAITNLNSISSTNFNLTFAQLAQAGATSDDYTIRFNISNTSGQERNGWGNGGIYPYMSTNQNADGRLAEWTGKNENSWTYEYTLSELKKLAGSGAAGIRIMTWNSCDVTSIEIVPPADNLDITLGTTISRELTNLAQNSMVSAAQLSDVAVGDKIKIEINNVSNGAKIQILNMGSPWGTIVGQTDINNATTYYELEVTNDNINKIKDGIDIQGTGFTITKVTLEKAPVGTYAVSVVKGVNCNTVNLSADKDAVNGKYPEGTNITLTATAPNEWNYQFLGWFKDDATTASSTNETYAFELSSTNAGNYTAKYDVKNQAYTFGPDAINFALKTNAYSVTIAGSEFPSSSAIGSKTYRMTLNFSGAVSGATLHILKTNGSWSDLTTNAALTVNNDGTATYVVDITSANINNYTDGIAVQRNNNSPNLVFVSGTIEEVAVETGGGGETAALLWTGTSFSSGSTWLELNYSGTFKSGDKLIFTSNDLTKISLAFGDWDPKIESGITKTSTGFEYVISDNVASVLNNKKQVMIYGTEGTTTLTEIKLVPKE